MSKREWKYDQRPAREGEGALSVTPGRDTMFRWGVEIRIEAREAPPETAREAGVNEDVKSPERRVHVGHCVACGREVRFYHLNQEPKAAPGAVYCSMHRA